MLEGSIKKDVKQNSVKQHDGDVTRKNEGGG